MVAIAFTFSERITGIVFGFLTTCQLRRKTLSIF